MLDPKSWEGRTPGPWQVATSQPETVLGPSQAYVADCRKAASVRPMTERIANAALIAAAPELADRVKVLEAALTDVLWVLERAEELPIPDPMHATLIMGLGDRVGYGALMTTASALWRKHLQDTGLPGGGEFVCSPCRSQVKSALSQARTALASPVTGLVESGS